jgi:hypothetical protein
MAWSTWRRSASKPVQAGYPLDGAAEAILAAGALHRFAARLGFALRAAKDEGVSDVLVDPLVTLLQKIGDTCRPAKAASPAVALRGARPEVQLITSLLAKLAEPQVMSDHAAFESMDVLNCCDGGSSGGITTKEDTPTSCDGSSRGGKGKGKSFKGKVTIPKAFLAGEPNVVVGRIPSVPDPFSEHDPWARPPRPRATSTVESADDVSSSSSVSDDNGPQCIDGMGDRVEVVGMTSGSFQHHPQPDPPAVPDDTGENHDKQLLDKAMLDLRAMQERLDATNAAAQSVCDRI